MKNQNWQIAKKKSKKGAHSPDMRVLSMGVYPIQKVNSQVLGQDDVSNERTLMTMPTEQNKKT